MCFGLIFSFTYFLKGSSVSVVTLSLSKTWILFSSRGENRARNSHSELNLINRPSIECFLAKCTEEIKSSSRKWGEGTIIVGSFIYHSRQSGWRQDNYTICSQTAVKNLSLLPSERNSLWTQVNPSSSFLWLAKFPSGVILMHISFVLVFRLLSLWWCETEVRDSGLSVVFLLGTTNRERKVDM